MVLSVIILGISRWKLYIGQPTVQSLFRLHGSAGWSGSILVLKANHFWFLKLSQFDIQFIIKIHVGSMPMSIQYITIYKITCMPIQGNKIYCQKWDSNPRRENPTATWTQRLRPLGHPDISGILNRTCYKICLRNSR